MIKLDVKIKEQKENECLSACLKSVFDYYQVDNSEEEIINKISKESFKLYDWEFKAGKLAIEKGLKAEIYSNATQLFDPSWYNISSSNLIQKMKKVLEFAKYRNANFEKDPDLRDFICPNKEVAERLVGDIEALLKFLTAGGVINFNPVSKELIEEIIESNVPIIASHNPTLLHRINRSYNFQSDDIKGSTWGHVAIISGFTDEKFILNDPDGMFYKKNLVYEIDKDLILESILIYNGQLLIIRK